MNILVLEDEINEKKILKGCIEEKFLDVRVYQARTEEDAKEIINNNTIDLFFIDTKLKDSSGLEFAKYIRQIEKYEISPIVIISNDVSYMIDALKKVNCFDFLLKPNIKKEVCEIVEKFLRHLKNIESNNYTFFKDIMGNQIKIYHKEILFLEYYLKRCIIHTRIGTVTIRANGLEKIIKKINYKNIKRTHKSYAVNFDNAKEVKKINSKLWEVVFNNYDKTADLSYSFRNKLELFK